MADRRQSNGARAWYQRLIRLYPRAYHERLGESMLQTFDDMCAEREHVGARFLLWAFADTLGDMVSQWAKAAATQARSEPLAIVGMLLVLPITVLMAIAVVWQVLYAIGWAGLPDPGAFVPNRTVGLTLILVLRMAALALNASWLGVRAVRRDVGPMLSLQAVRTNVLTLAVMALSAAVMVFAFGHDSVPCFVHGVSGNGLHGLWQLAQTCAKA